MKYKDILFISTGILLFICFCIGLYYGAYEQQIIKDACDKKCHPYKVSFCDDKEVGCYTDDPSIIKRIFISNEVNSNF